VPGRRAKTDPLFTTTWIHVFEEDSGGGAVYRAEDDATIPLSRRPRDRINLEPDGSARISSQGPDDRYIERPATWTKEGRALVIREGTVARELFIVEQSPSRLLIRSESGSGPPPGRALTDTE